MKLEVDVNTAVLSNVGTTGEFKIRNSAKAFKILSDGLYSNKIRAIIRELSCNAVDSHVGSGKETMPFEVHLPTVFEPWFYVKDFGMGLDNDQVVNIYTTYFESTKTDSNAFIGALGLGSKSPFSYTENFTVTAIKDGIKRIYSAFINENGVPSIAQMNEEPTDECNGVEVKFSVTDRNDYHTFKQEARSVFAWFKCQPIISGVDHFEHKVIDYKEKDIVPGVHTSRTHTSSSVALMGNIAYPLDNVPAIEKNLGSLAPLLDCGLIIEFDIGELDFAASREQLSYVPSTIASIKKKLELLTSNLVIHLAAKADAIENEWERSFFLTDSYRDSLYMSSVEKYVKDTKFPLFDKSAYRSHKVFEYTLEDLESRGLTIQSFTAQHGSSKNRTPESRYTHVTGNSTLTKYWLFRVERDVVIILNDLKTGCLARSRYHSNQNFSKYTTVYIINHNSSDMDIRDDEYTKVLAELHNPPTVLKASELDKVERLSASVTQGIMYVQYKPNSYGSRHKSYKWVHYGTEIDDAQVYYYVALNNFSATGKDGKEIDALKLKEMMNQCGLPSIESINIMGVRKSMIKDIKDRDNWIPIEDILTTETSKVSDKDVASFVVAEVLDPYYGRVYISTAVAKLIDADSDYAKFVKEYGAMKRRDGSIVSLATLCSQYGKSLQVEEVKTKITKVKNDIYGKYPFLKFLSNSQDTVTVAQVAEYISMVDAAHKN